MNENKAIHAKRLFWMIAVVVLVFIFIWLFVFGGLRLSWTDSDVDNYRLTTENDYQSPGYIATCKYFGIWIPNFHIMFEMSKSCGNI